LGGIYVGVEGGGGLVEWGSNLSAGTSIQINHSGGSRGRAQGGLPPYFGLKKKKNHRRKKNRQGKQKKKTAPHPPPPL